MDEKCLGESIFKDYTNFGGETLKIFRYERRVSLSHDWRCDNVGIFRGVSYEDVNSFMAKTLKNLKKPETICDGSEFYSPKLREVFRQLRNKN